MKVSVLLDVDGPRYGNIAALPYRTSSVFHIEDVILVQICTRCRLVSVCTFIFSILRCYRKTILSSEHALDNHRHMTYHLIHGRMGRFL